MTMEEELDWLCRLRSEIYVYIPKEWLIPMNNALDMAIKALEQGPILDKVRAEIADLDDADYDYEGYYKAVTDALQIIDKYKAESEE